MKLGKILVDQKLITQEHVEEAVALQAETGKRFGQIMVEKGWIDEKDLLVVLSAQLGLPHIWMRPGIYDPEAIKLISKETALRLELLPLFLDDAVPARHGRLIKNNFNVLRSSCHENVLVHQDKPA